MEPFSFILHERGNGSSSWLSVRQLRSLLTLCQMAYWFGFAAVAGAFGGILAFAIEDAVVPFSNWRLLFIIEVCKALQTIS